MNVFKLILFSIITFIFLVLATPIAKANEGTVNLSSGESICLATSVETESNEFSVLIRCSNLIYPPSKGGNTYLVWTRRGTRRPELLGELEFGKVLLSAREPFDSLLITSE